MSYFFGMGTVFSNRTHLGIDHNEKDLYWTTSKFKIFVNEKT